MDKIAKKRKLDNDINDYKRWRKIKNKIRNALFMVFSCYGSVMLIIFFLSMKQATQNGTIDKITWFFQHIRSVAFVSGSISAILAVIILFVIIDDLIEERKEDEYFNYIEQLSEKIIEKERRVSS